LVAAVPTFVGVSNRVGAMVDILVVVGNGKHALRALRFGLAPQRQFSESSELSGRLASP
jgi:hypothetical protein